MLSINQNSVLKKFKLCDNLIEIDEDAIREDIEVIKLNDNSGQAIKYLESLGGGSRYINLRWGFIEGILKSTPIQLFDIPYYNINFTKYLILKEDIIKIDLHELADIIAFELMHRDLGETHESLEEKLKDVSIIRTHDSELLVRHFKDSPYKLSRELKIEKSPYIDYNNTNILEYFLSRRFNLGYYKNVISYSCRKAMSLIVGNYASRKSGIKLYSLSDTYIYISNIPIDLVSDSISIRAIGRLFEIKPKLSVIKKEDKYES